MLENVIIRYQFPTFQAGLIINAPKSNADTAVCLHVLHMMINRFFSMNYPVRNNIPTRSR